MDNGLDLYDDIVPAYIRMVAQDSPEAGAAVEKICALYGSRAALRATMVINLVKIDMQAKHTLQDVDTYGYLMMAFPEARLLLEFAISCCLEAWGFPVVRPVLADDAAPVDGVQP